jgi:hypothetical protein
VLPTRSVISTWCFSQNGKELYVGDAEGHLGTVDVTTHELHTLNGEHDGRVLDRSFWGRPGSRPLPRMARPGFGMCNESSAPWWLLTAEHLGREVQSDSRWFVCAGTGAAEIRDAHSASLETAADESASDAFGHFSRWPAGGCVQRRQVKQRCGTPTLALRFSRTSRVRRPIMWSFRVMAATSSWCNFFLHLARHRSKSVKQKQAGRPGRLSQTGSKPSLPISARIAVGS